MSPTRSAAGPADSAGSPPTLIDARINELKDWCGTTLALVRTLIRPAAPGAVKELKWRRAGMAR
jgi:hypothetical protein